MDETRLLQLKGNTHPLALAEFDRGAAPAGLPMERMLLVLKRGPEQEARLTELIEEQLDASSPNFHCWLTPEEFGAQFGPSSQDLQTVTSWLASHGFHVVRVSKGRTVIEFSGTAGQIEEAFHTAIHKYVLNAEEHWANASDPWIPAALVPVVGGVDALNNFPRKTMLTFPSPCGVAGIRPSGNCYGVGPYDFATIYNLLPLWNSGIDGMGQSIAIVAASDVHVQDVRNFRSLFALPANDPIIIYNGPNPGFLNTALGPETEALADVEWAGATAKGATIVLVVSATTNSTPGVELSAEYVVDHNLAPALSASYGYCELALGTAGNQFHNQLWQQAAAQGITVVVATGDSGSAMCDSPRGTPPSPAQSGLGVNGVGSTPYNVAVGGTIFNDLTNGTTFWNSTNDPNTKASAKGYIPETAWNDSCTNSLFASLLGFSTDPEANCNNSQLSQYVRVTGGSGGKSNCTMSDGQSPTSCSGGYGKPSWQAGPGVPSDGLRDVPDVALFSGGGLTGAFFLICQADQNPDGSGACDVNSANAHIQGVGGTSGSAPAFAGIVALAVQKSGSRQGNINPLLYRLAAQQSPTNCNSSGPASGCVFNDVSLGTIAMPCKKGTHDCNVSNPSDPIGVLNGYDAGPGYDLATGLGSVNAFNLVNASDWTNNTAADFALSSTNSTVTVSGPGKSGTLTLTITSVNGFDGTFTPNSGSCIGLPFGATCVFSTGSVSVNSTSPAAQVTVTVTTTARSAFVPASFQNKPRSWATIGVAALLCALCIGLGPKARANRLRCATVVATFVFWSLVCAAGCGGGGGSGTAPGSGNPGTPSGTTNAILAISSSGITHSFIFTVNVQ
ncbi:MAG: S53 family peptidase [Candidatus Acidiferrum sp.]